jgi:hypothetical protein
VYAGLAALGTLTVACEKVLTGGSGGVRSIVLLLLSEQANRQAVVSKVQERREKERMAGVLFLI